ncbi:IPExxxVDY family protein [Sediminibacterium salmoneum]|uniref:IPExxxVDY family protein n=1 Tax=Sediminibacterium salmoneum TaxID=426421 RepID=UPI00047AD777|nr:IPExxxVDY family protein [Sediminibacterium salmoneum]
MKLKLDVDELNEDFFEETRLLGITATIKNYQFCMQLNASLGYDFRLNPELEIQLFKKNRNYFFSIYQFKEYNSPLTHYLYQNQYDGEYLLPEFKHMDFLWLMKYDWVDDEKCNWIKSTVRNLSGVQLVAELTNEQIKNKGNMVF